MYSRYPLPGVFIFIHYLLLTMKRNILFILLLAMLSAISGFLMSNMSWIGRIGINLMHKEYKFLKVWWQGGLVVFGALMVLFALHAILEKALPFILAKIMHVVLFFAAVGGLYYTYTDFSDDVSHRWLRDVFHVGAYLFWAGWMMTCVFFLTSKKKNDPDKLVEQKSSIK